MKRLFLVVMVFVFACGAATMAQKTSGPEFYETFFSMFRDMDWVTFRGVFSESEQRHQGFMIILSSKDTDKFDGFIFVDGANGGRVPYCIYRDGDALKRYVVPTGEVRKLDLTYNQLAYGIFGDTTGVQIK